MKAAQRPVFDVLIHDQRPIHLWVQCLLALSHRVYPQDSVLAAQLEAALNEIRSTAANLDCIGTDDPEAPAVGAPAQNVLGYFFSRWPEMRSNLNRLMSRADQILGRQQIVAAFHDSPASSHGS